MFKTYKEKIKKNKKNSLAFNTNNHAPTLSIAFVSTFHLKEIPLHEGGGCDYNKSTTSFLKMCMFIKTSVIKKDINKGICL